MAQSTSARILMALVAILVILSMVWGAVRFP